MHVFLTFFLNMIMCIACMFVQVGKHVWECAHEGWKTLKCQSSGTILLALAYLGHQDLVI